MNKIKREIIRLYSKISDYFFLTSNFFNYQVKFSKAYQFNYTFNKNKICIIHPPKTGGTTISTVLAKSKKIYEPGAHTLLSKKCSAKKFKYIFLIRDPIDRVFSYYNMSLKNKKLPFHNHAKSSLNNFVKKVRINQNGLCKFLIGSLDDNINIKSFEIAKKNLSNMEFIIDFNYINHSLNSLKKKLNIKLRKKIHFNLDKNKKKITIFDKKIIIKENYYDIKLYKFYKKNLQKKFLKKF